MILLILVLLGAVVVILGARRPVRALPLWALGIGGVGLLGVWLEYGTIQPCSVLTHQIVQAERRAGRWAPVVPATRLFEDHGV